MPLDENIVGDIGSHEKSQARELLMGLDIETRKMFVLKYYYGYNYREIGEMLKIPEGTVKSRFHYAIKELRIKEVIDDG